MLKDAYAELTDRVGEAAQRSGRAAEEVMVVAVTKYSEMSQVRAMLDLGHMDFGENQGQQLAQRVPQANEFLTRKQQLDSRGDTPDRIRWHMVGHLQRNKVKQVVPHVNLIHSVDSLRLVEELHGFGNKTDSVVDILLQVNVSGEATKHGIVPPAVRHLVDQIDLMLHLRLRGLMTMAPYSENPEDARDVFKRTRELFEETQALDSSGNQFNILSMGMSGDYAVAIEEGSNCVRIGRALFGEQPPDA